MLEAQHLNKRIAGCLIIKILQLKRLTGWLTLADWTAAGEG
jgi:hypothetical protein